MKIISLSGKKGSGKTTVANLIKQTLLDFDSDLEVDIFSFADPLKQEVAKAIGHTVMYVEEHKKELRLLLQAWGTDFRRQLCGNDYWIDQLFRRIVDSNADIIIIGDTRFLNEAKRLAYIGATLWWVDRKGVDTSDNHPSETELDLFPFNRVIPNNGPLGELRGTIKVILEQEHLIKYV